MTTPGVPPTVAATPLAGRRVLVPRAVDRAAELIDLLTRAGAEPLPVPLIDTCPEPSTPDMQRAAADLVSGAFDWVAFTSAAGVAAMVSAGGDGTALPVGDATRVAAVGDATAAAVRAAGIRVDLQPVGAGSGAALAEALIAADSADPRTRAGRAVLLPRSDRARPDLPNALRAAGYHAREVVAYRTVTLAVPAAVARDLEAGRIDAVLLTSPSTVAALGETRPATATVVIAIGHSTAQAARAAGIPVTAVASRPTASDLVATLAGAVVGGPTAASPTTGTTKAST